MECAQILLGQPDKGELIERDTWFDASGCLCPGANNIANLKQSVDALNVFPVPDGDTGTNMSMTIGAQAGGRPPGRQHPRWGGGPRPLLPLCCGCPGNSGVILSLLFRGFSKGPGRQRDRRRQGFGRGPFPGGGGRLQSGDEPTEGTILTVARLAAEHAAEVVTDETTVPEIWDEILSAGRIALENTPSSSRC